jgi:uncharacterized protein (TIGR00304 family)
MHLWRAKNLYRESGFFCGELDLSLAGIALVLVGFGVVAVAMITSAGKGEVKGAGVVLIGPIPIVFGSDAKWATVAIILAIVLVVLSLLFYVV